MCSIQVISNNSFGCVLICDKCDHLHLGFGNLVIAYSPNDFTAFVKTIQKLSQSNPIETFSDGDVIYLPTENENMAITLNRNELSQLNDLLNEAGVMLQLKEILSEK